MPYSDAADQRRCDARYRERHQEFRRASWRQWVRAHPDVNSRNTRRWLRKRRLALHRRDGWRCVYCRRRGTRRTLTIDHRIPRKDNGPSTLDNLVSACRSCNQRKGVTPYGVFMDRMRVERGETPLWILNDEPASSEPLTGGFE